MAPTGTDDAAAKAEYEEFGVKNTVDSWGQVTPKFLKPPAERPSIPYNVYCKEIPVVSLANVEEPETRTQIVADIAYACQEWGVFQIVNHGVPDSLMVKMKEMAQQFFGLPLDEKVKYATAPGKFPVGYASGSHRSDDGILDWRELMVHVCLPERDTSMWPTTPTDYSETLLKYSSVMDDVVTRLLGLISEGLGLPTSQLKEALGGADASQKILCNYYPMCPQPDLTLGLRSHTDYGSLTVLQQDNVGGLQALKESTGKWVTVEPIPNALVINLGDQIQIMTNGKYQSVEHQAVVNANAERLTIVTFANPAQEAQMGPLKSLVDENFPAKYRSYKFSEYLPICYAKKTRKHYDALVI